MEGDIYRGQVPPTPVPIAESVAAPSSASSSGSFITARLGALAAIVEHAITRWTRSRRLAGSSASVLSQSSTTSLTSSIYTSSRPRLTRWRQRRTSSANARSVHSEREVAARLMARKEIQSVDRGFTLYIPPSSNPEVATTTQILETFDSTEQSLHIILNRLEAALKKASRKNVKGKQRQHSLGLPPLSLRSDFMSDSSMPPRPASFTDLSTLRSSIQGKQKKYSSSQGTRAHSKSTPEDTHEFNRAPKAWWLDVASPTWDDLQNIDKLLHIHPLTLEDILQQDPREKMEPFVELGYYFISFRAVQNAIVTQPVHQKSSNDTDVDQVDDDALRESNIYMVVFKEGICTFYFTDVSEHIKKVRHRVQDNFGMSSDWIAHGILDSVVDSFFPLLKDIGRQVLYVESLVFPQNDVSSSTNTLVDINHIPTDDPCDSELKKYRDTQPSSKESGENAPSWNPLPLHPRFTEPLFFQRLKRNLQNLLKTSAPSRKIKIKPAQAMTTSTLLRMAKARRLVTSLVRLLAMKSNVVSQIRKRFLTDGRQTASLQGDEDAEIAIHMGDVQDHILTLLQSLHHYEGILSQSHLTYLTRLRVTLFKIRDRNDNGMVIISVIALGDMCLQVLAGFFSMNVHTPRSIKYGQGAYHYFMMIMFLCVGVEAIFLVVVRHWWTRATRTRPRLS